MGHRGVQLLTVKSEEVLPGRAAGVMASGITWHSADLNRGWLGLHGTVSAAPCHCNGCNIRLKGPIFRIKCILGV